MKVFIVLEFKKTGKQEKTRVHSVHLSEDDALDTCNAQHNFNLKHNRKNRVYNYINKTLKYDLKGIIK